MVVHLPHPERGSAETTLATIYILKSGKILEATASLSVVRSIIMADQPPSAQQQEEDMGAVPQLLIGSDDWFGLSASFGLDAAPEIGAGFGLGEVSNLDDMYLPAPPAWHPGPAFSYRSQAAQQQNNPPRAVVNSIETYDYPDEEESELMPEQAIQPVQISYELHIEELAELPGEEPIQQSMMVDVINYARELPYELEYNDNAVDYPIPQPQPEWHGQAQEEYPVGDLPMEGCGSFLLQELLPPAPMPVFQSGESDQTRRFIPNVPAVSYEPLFEHEDRPAYDHMPLRPRPIPSENRPYDLLELLGPPPADYDAGSDCNKENNPNTLDESLRSAVLSFSEDTYDIPSCEADAGNDLQHEELEASAAPAAGPRAAADQFEAVDNERTPTEDEPEGEPSSPALIEDKAADGEHDTVADAKTNDSSQINAPSGDSQDDTRYALADDSAQSALPSEDFESDSSSEEDNVPLARFAGPSWQCLTPAAPSKSKKNVKSTPARQTRQAKRRGTMELRSSKFT